MNKRFPKTCAYLAKRGVEVAFYKRKLFAIDLTLVYPLPCGEVKIVGTWSKFFGSFTFMMTFPKPSKELEEVYDSFFPEEKTMFGRSSPSFRQAIMDYERGQKKAENPISVVYDGKQVTISGGVATHGKGDEGLLSGLENLSKTMRTGPLHGDVLFHLFA